MLNIDWLIQTKYVTYTLNTNQENKTQQQNTQPVICNSKISHCANACSYWQLFSEVVYQFIPHVTSWTYSYKTWHVYIRVYYDQTSMFC